MPDGNEHRIYLRISYSSTATLESSVPLADRKSTCLQCRTTAFRQSLPADEREQTANFVAVVLGWPRLLALALVTGLREDDY
jgi:hypothetical protein